VSGAPKSIPAERLRALAGLVFGEDHVATVPKPAPKEKRGRFGRRH